MRLKLAFVAVLSGIGLAASVAGANAGSTDIAIETIEDVTHGDLRKLVELSTWLEDWDAFKQTQSFTCCMSPTPLPAALPLYGVGLGAIGLLSWYRKRKSKTKAESKPS